MTQSPLPDNWQDLMAGYALGDLSAEEAEALQRILAESPEAIAEADRLQEALALMPQSLPDRAPPPHLRHAILEAARASRTLPKLFQDTCPPPRPRQRLIRQLGVGGAIAAAILSALALDNYRLRQTVEQTQTLIGVLQQPGTQLYALSGTESAASGSLILAPEQQQVFVVIRALPQLPSSQVYRLWAMPAPGASPAYCGQFNTGAAGSVSTQWSLPAAVCSNRPAQMLITAELAADPPVPKGDLVMKSQG